MEGGLAGPGKRNDEYDANMCRDGVLRYECMSTARPCAPQVYEYGLVCYNNDVAREAVLFSDVAVVESSFKNSRTRTCNPWSC